MFAEIYRNIGHEQRFTNMKYGAHLGRSQKIGHTFCPNKFTGCIFFQQKARFLSVIQYYPKIGNTRPRATDCSFAVIMIHQSPDYTRRESGGHEKD